MQSSNQNAIEIATFYFRSNQYELAKEILTKLISSKEANSKCFELLAYIFGNEGDGKEALRLLRIACSYENASAESHYYFGKELIKIKQFEDAINHLTQSIKIGGEFFEGLFELGFANVNLNNFNIAEKHFKKALSLNPNHIDVIFNLAKLYHENLDNHNKATELYLGALKIQNTHIPSLIGLGEVYEKSNQLDKALELYEKAISITESFVTSWLCLGRVRSKLGQIDNALDSLNKLFSNKKSSDFFFIKGTFLLEKRDFNYALENFEIAINLFHDNSSAWEYKSIAQHSLGFTLDAISSIEKSISLNNKNASSWKRRGDYYLKECNYQLAIESYEKAIELDELFPLLISSYLNVKLLTMSWFNIDYFFERIKHNKDQFLDPITLLYLSDDPIFILNNNKKYSDYIYKKFNIPYKKKNLKSERIKIAYFSPDFKKHPVSFLTKDIFKNHDRKRFEVFGFFINNKGRDELTEEISKLFDHFIDITELADQDAIELIRNFNIDVAFDLTGHTKNERTNIFLNRISGIQINFIGYPNTMGSEMYDYIIADRYLISQKDEQYFSEKIIYFPLCFQPNSTRYFNHIDLKESIYKNTNKYFIYCCFNFGAKISKELLKLWIEIIKNTHNSILWLNVEKYSVSNLSEQIKLIDASILERIIFFERSSYEIYLNRFKIPNLFLDTFPFGGGTTTSDALYSGLPVLTLAGKSFHNRMSKSLLQNLELNELVTDSYEAYKQTAIRLCMDKNFYQLIKYKLNLALTKSSVFNCINYTKNLEKIILDLVTNS